MSNTSTTTSSRNIDPDDLHRGSKDFGQNSPDTGLHKVFRETPLVNAGAKSSSGSSSKLSRNGKVLERRGASGVPVSYLQLKHSQTSSTSIEDEEPKPFIPPLSLEKVEVYKRTYVECELQKDFTVDSPASRASSLPPSDDGTAREVAASAGFRVLAEGKLDKAVDKMMQNPSSGQTQATGSQAWVTLPNWASGLLGVPAKPSQPRVTSV